MSIKATLSAESMEVYSVPTLKELCLYRCLKDRDIMTKVADVVEDVDVDLGGNQLEIEKYRLKEPIDKKLVEDLLDAGSEYLFQMTPHFEKILAGIRISQPQDLVKLDFSNTEHLQDSQFEFLFSGGNVKWLDINGCSLLTGGALDVINRYGRKLEYLRIGHCCAILPECVQSRQEHGILETRNLKTFIINDFYCEPSEVSVYCKHLLRDFITNVEHLQIRNMLHFGNLEFLEPAINNLISLSLANCRVLGNTDPWATIFKLHKLKSLELIGSRFQPDSLNGNVVPRILTSMPNLVRLVVNPGFFMKKDLYNFSPEAGRLDILGVMDNEEDDLIKAEILSKKVICFGSAEKELRLLKYYSNQLNVTYYEPTFQRFVYKLNSNPTSWQSVTAVTLIMNIFKNNGVGVVDSELFFSIIGKIFTTEILAKCGNVLKDQLLDLLLSSMTGLASMTVQNLPPIVIDLIDMLTYLNPELPFEQYSQVVSIVTSITERAVLSTVLRLILVDRLLVLLRTTSRILEMAVGRFCSEELNKCWGLSSVLKVITEFPDILRLLEEEEDREHLMETFSSLILSLKRLCLSSAIRRQTFRYAGGVRILLKVLDEIYVGTLRSAERNGVIILDILKSTLQDPALNILDADNITSCLERIERLISNRQ